ncbi:MAG: arylsulfatase [Cyanobacteria bacterium P01_F01_bin.143]
MYRKISQFVLATGIGTLSIIGVSFLKAESEVKAGRSAGIEKPNIVMLIADDMGYSDLGIYGSEISTPNIDALAHEGMILTNFHTGPSCSPTRSMLLTGVDNHYAGLGNMLEKLAPSQKGQPNYEGYLNDKVVTLPSLLRDNGYHTYMSGKWHLGGVTDPKTGEKEGFDPYERGFEETFTMLEGGGDHYSMRGFSPFIPVNDFTRNGEKLTELPEDFYSTTSFTNQMIEYVDSQYRDGKPFFSYLAYSAPHSPYQAPKEIIEKYIPVYEQGWDNIRAERFKRMKELGVIPKYLELPGRWPEVGSWSSLGPEKQKISAKKMASYAAMIEYLDTEIGRYLQYLKDIGEYDNTIFIFMTDNGADGHNRQESEVYEKWFAEEGIDNSYENMGLRDSFVTRNIGWAQVSATPHWGEKAGHSEGGITGAFFVSYTGFLDSGQSKAFASVRDVTPTLLEYAGIAHPGSLYKGREVYPMSGKSMRPLWEGYSDRIYAKDEPIVFETFGTGDAAVFLGNWKILRQNPEWGDGTWKLYNLEIDPTERNDLSRIYPTLLQNMINEYEAYAQEVQVIPDNRVGE